MDSLVDDGDALTAGEQAEVGLIGHARRNLTPRRHAEIRYR
jgi:hypothetical protein